MTAADMIQPERVKFEEIKERAKQGVLLQDDFEWLAIELDSYSRAWKTERENLRKLTDINLNLGRTLDKMAGSLKALADEAEKLDGLEYEVRMAREVIKEAG